MENIINILKASVGGMMGRVTHIQELQKNNLTGSVDALISSKKSDFAAQLKDPKALFKIDSVPLPENSVHNTGALPDLGDMVGNLVKEVDAKQKISDIETQKIWSGNSDNIHKSIVVMQEAGVAFSLMVKVRNTLMESYQELMRMTI